MGTGPATLPNPCVTCRSCDKRAHHGRDAGPEYWTCERLTTPAMMGIHHVTGVAPVPVRLSAPCINERQTTPVHTTHPRCGPDGRYWEPRQGAVAA